MSGSEDRQRVYYHHLKKCGGTAMNRWLDSQFRAYPDDFRTIQLNAFTLEDAPENRLQGERLRMKAFAENIFAVRDVMHDHAGVAAYVPPGTFRFTVLRNPETRLLSQIRDYRRISRKTWPNYPPRVTQMLADSASLGVADFLERYAHYNAPHGTFFDNYMVRALAQDQIGALAYHTEDAADLVGNALDALNLRFDVVGLLEEADETNRILAARLGWAPLSRALHLNSTVKEGAKAETLDDPRTRALIERATEHDWLVYEEGKRLFEEIRRATPAYDRDDFERDHLAGRLAQLVAAPDPTGKGAIYGVDQPIVGAGNKGRRRTDSEGLELVVSPDDPFVLYIPVPPRRQIDLVLGFEKQANFPNANSIADLFAVDDVAVEPVVSEDRREITLRVSTSKKGWARLVYARPEGTEARPKPVFGIARYGWRAIPRKGFIQRVLR